MNTLIPAEVTAFLGTTSPADLFQMLIAAIVTGFAMTVTPKKLKILAFVYMASMAGIFYLHATQYLNMALLVGVVATVVLFPFRPKTKTA